MVINFIAGTPETILSHKLVFTFVLDLHYNCLYRSLLLFSFVLCYRPISLKLSTTNLLSPDNIFEIRFPELIIYSTGNLYSDTKHVDR